MGTGIGAHVASQRQVARVVVVDCIQVSGLAAGVDRAAAKRVGDRGDDVDVLPARVDQAVIVQGAAAGGAAQGVVQPGKTYFGTGQVVEHRAVVERRDVIHVGLVEVEEPGVVDGDVVKVHVVVVAAGDGGRNRVRDHQRAAANHGGVGSVGIDGQAAVDNKRPARRNRERTAGAEARRAIDRQIAVDREAIGTKCNRRAQHGGTSTRHAAASLRKRVVYREQARSGESAAGLRITGRGDRRVGVDIAERQAETVEIGWAIEVDGSAANAEALGEVRSARQRQSAAGCDDKILIGVQLIRKQAAGRNRDGLQTCNVDQHVLSRRRCKTGAPVRAGGPVAATADPAVVNGTARP